MSKELRAIISKRIDKTQDCDFKRKWIPKGYFCARKDKFIKELVKDLVTLK